MGRSVGDVSKLPKWAQDELLSLGRRLARAEELLAQASGIADTDTHAMRSLDEPPFGLEREARVRFRLSEHFYVDIRTHKGQGGAGRSIYVNGSDAFCVYPMVTNALYIAPWRRR